MPHLSEAELVDLAEGTRPESGAAHLQACERCRRQLSDLRAALASAQIVDVPEPSPLFWDHLSARVLQAVAAECRPERPGIVSWLAPWATPGNGGRLAIWSTAGAAALIAIIVGGTWMRTPAADPTPAATRTVVAVPVAITSPAPDDAALTLVAQLAENMDDDAAAELTPMDATAHPGVVEESVSSMSAGEREELGRLLREEMRRRGI